MPSSHETTNIREQFQLDPDVIYLNHGSFGACPKPIFQVYQEYQKQLERQPVQFLTRDYPELDAQSRTELGHYLNADPEDLVFIPNATHGVNIIARSIALQPGDEILTTNLEYGACEKTWQYLCQKTGARLVPQDIATPFGSPEDIVTQIFSGCTLRTKVLFISHISSPTGLILPVAELVRAAHEKGIVSVVDGAHAPGQIPLDMTALGADYYTGNCHKWMLCPKGCAFLYVRKECQKTVDPLVISWGWRQDFSPVQL